MAAPTPSPAALYTRTAHTAAAQVIRRYSTSFSLSLIHISEPTRPY